MSTPISIVPTTSIIPALRHGKAAHTGQETPTAMYTAIDLVKPARPIIPGTCLLHQTRYIAQSLCLGARLAKAPHTILTGITLSQLVVAWGPQAMLCRLGNPPHLAKVHRTLSQWSASYLILSLPNLQSFTLTPRPTTITVTRVPLRSRLGMLKQYRHRQEKA